MIDQIGIIEYNDSSSDIFNPLKCDEKTMAEEDSRARNNLRKRGAWWNFQGNSHQKVKSKKFLSQPIPKKTRCPHLILYPLPLLLNCLTFYLVHIMKK